MYESFKETGEKWLRCIPERWEICRLKSLFSFGKGLPITKADLIENGTPVISYGQVHSKANSGTGLSTSLFRFVSDDFLSTNKQSLVKKGDFIFADTSEDRNGCGNCVYIDKNIPIFAGYHSIILKTKKAFDNKYLAYLFLTDHWRFQIRSKVDGVKVFSVSKPILSSTNIVLPPREEQDQIVRYLDWQVSKINKLIHGYQREIKLLEERKKTTIDNAVTHGIDNSVTQIQTPEAVWFSSIPNTWRATKMREVFSERNEKVSDKEYQALSVGKMGVVPQLETAVKTDNGDNRKLICKGDFAINSRSDRKGAGGISEYIGSASLIITVLKPRKELNSQFYHNLLRSHYFSEEFYRNGHGLVSDLWTTKWDEMRNIYIPVPPIDIQESIVEYLDNEVGKVDDAINKTNEKIDLLREYRSRLISDVVTGQIDVRGIEIPDYTPETDAEDEPNDVEISDEEATENE